MKLPSETILQQPEVAKLVKDSQDWGKDHLRQEYIQLLVSHINTSIELEQLKNPKIILPH